MKRVTTRLSLLLATLAFFSAPVNKARSNDCSSTFSHADDAGDRAMRVREEIEELQQDFDDVRDGYSDDAPTDVLIVFIGKVCSHIDQFIKLNTRLRDRSRAAMEDFGVTSIACTGVNRDSAMENADIFMEMSIVAGRNLKMWKKEKGRICSE